MATEPRVTVHPEGAAAESPAPEAQVGGAAAPAEVAAGGPATPTAEILRRNLESAVIDDVLDPTRKIKLRKPSVLAQYRLMEVMGGDRATNQPLVQMTQPLMFVQEIGDQAVFFPATWEEVEALIERLGEGGMTALMIWYSANVTEPINNAIQQAQKDRLKNV